MNEKITTTAYAISKFGRIIAIVLASSIMTHLVVMAIEYLTIKKPLYLDLHGDFIGGAFSFPMLPMIIAYGLLITGTYALWSKMKKTLLRINEIELERVNDQSVIKAMQRTSVMLAKYITENNNAIMQWLYYKKEKGQQVPVVVERSCMNISMVLQTLNRFSYVVPYDNAHADDALADLERKLEMELDSIKIYRGTILKQ
jgi:hypothetical protein